MPTQAQLNANRLNAQKSTGPTSPEGKAASSLNALKSGIDAWSHIIPGEDTADPSPSVSEPPSSTPIQPLTHKLASFRKVPRI